MSLLPTLAVLGLLVLMAEASDPCSQCYGARRNPVCGYYNNVYQTYDNDCLCRCRGITSYTYGSCTERRCSVRHPVCGSDGRTYSNPCTAAYYGVKVHGWGNCGPQLRVCLSGPSYHTYDPVCCTDGHNYYNRYYATCAGAAVAYGGACRAYAAARPAYCDCSRYPYEYVCGYDLRTYNNPCSAKCAGVQVKHVGRCQAASSYGRYRADYPAGYRTGYDGAYPGGYRAGYPRYSDTYYRTAACDVKCSAHNDRYPVCCSDYRTYQNACQARCAGAHIFYYGRCDRQVYYSKNYGQCGNCYGQSRNLVCGHNGRTYYNQCFCDCASSDYYSYKRIGFNYQGQCRGFNYARYYL